MDTGGSEVFGDPMDHENLVARSDTKNYISQSVNHAQYNSQSNDHVVIK